MEKSDHDRIVEIHSVVMGARGVLESLDAFEGRLHKTEGIAKEALSTARNGVSLADDNRRRLNRIASAQAIYATVASAIAGIAGWFGGPR